MATNITQRTTPQYWASSSDDIVYEFDFKNISIINQLDNGGYLQVTLNSVPAIAYNVGDAVYIYTFYFQGIYSTIKSIEGSVLFTLDLPYLTIGYNASDYLKILNAPSFDLYKGYKVGEDFPSNLPYTKVADLNSSYVMDALRVPYISLNVRTIIESIFNVTPFFLSNEPDYDLFNAIRLEYDSITTVFSTDHDYTCVLYSGLTNLELSETFSQNFHYLNPTDKQLLFSSGKTFGTGFTYSSGLISCPVTFKI